MKRIIVIALLVIAAAFFALGQTRRPKSRSGADRPERAPEGVIVTDKTVTLKEGFKFVRKSNKTIAIARIRTGVTEVVFTCACPDGSSCIVVVFPDAAHCGSQTDCCAFKPVGKFRKN